MRKRKHTETLYYKKAAALCMCAALPLTAFPALADDTEIGYATCSDYLNIRTDGNIESDVIGLIKNNGQMEILSKTEDGWYHIRSGHVDGYVSGEYVATGAEADSIAATAGYTTAEVGAYTLTVRAHQTEDSEIVGIAAEKDELEVVQDNGDWIKVILPDGTYGFVSCEYVYVSKEYALAETIEEMEMRLGVWDGGSHVTSGEVAQAAAVAADAQRAANDAAQAQADAQYEAEQAQAAADAEYQAYLDAQAAAEAAAQEQAQEEYDAQAEADAQAQADAEYQAYLDAQAAAEAAAQAQAEAEEAAAQAQAEADAAAQAQADAQAEYVDDSTYDSYDETWEDTGDDSGSDETWTDDTGYDESSEDTYDESYDESYDETYDDGSYEESYDDGSYEESYDDSSYEETYDDGSSGSSGSSSTGQAIADFACQYVGGPYVWGGTSLTNGADCSGFVMAVFSNFGISLPHNAAAQSGYGYAVDGSSLQPGDLVFYGSGISHVAIYIGGGSVVHAANSNSGIIISGISWSGTPVAYRRLV